MTNILLPQDMYCTITTHQIQYKPQIKKIKYTQYANIRPNTKTSVFETTL